jgi:ketosteroid isomerase-like protein
MPRATQQTIDLLTDYFAAMEAKDSDHFAAYYADDITLTFAGAPVITGRDAVRQQMIDTLSKVESLAHPLVNVWEEDDGVVIFEVDSAWTFRDGTTTTITACSIFTIHDDLITDQRVYVDNGPINHQLS